MNNTNIKSALVSFVISGTLAGALYVLQVGDVFAIDLHGLVNVVSIAVLVAVVSFLKSLGTSTDGTFAGIQIK